MAEEYTYKEKDLLTKVSKGDETAFEQLFSIYRDKPYRYLLQLTKSPEVAEELVMDIFMKLWLGKDLLLEIDNLSNFLFRVAHHKALDFFRITARHERLQKAYEVYFEHVEGPHADTLLLDEENKRLLQHAINCLPPQRKLVYSLSRDENLTYEQIAVELGLSRNTVKNTMMAALQSIRHQLNVMQGNPKLLLHLFFIS